MKLRAPNRSSTSPFLVGLIFWFVLIHSTHFASGRFHAKNKFWRCLVKVTRSMIDCSHQRHICCFVIRNNRRQYARKIRTTVPQDFIEILKTIPDVQNAQPAFGPNQSSSLSFHAAPSSAPSLRPTQSSTPSFHSIPSSTPSFHPFPSSAPSFHSIPSSTPSFHSTPGSASSFQPPISHQTSTELTTLPEAVESLASQAASKATAISPPIEYAIISPTPPTPGLGGNSNGMFQGGHRRGISKKKQDKLFKPNNYFGLHFHEIKPHVGYNKALCMAIKVPCRFVNDHPCCRFDMPIALVPRPRAMDGSADLLWRRPNARKDKSKVPQARSLFGSHPDDNQAVKYSFAKHKGLVKTPEYHYNGSPEVASTLLDNCWRLLYLDCSRDKFQEHPCCRLVTQDQSNPVNPSDNRLTRWLRLGRKS